MKQNNSTKLSAHSFLEFYIKNDTPDSPDPRCTFFPDFPIGIQPFLAHGLIGNAAMNLTEWLSSGDLDGKAWPGQKNPFRIT